MASTTASTLKASSNEASSAETLASTPRNRFAWKDKFLKPVKLLLLQAKMGYFYSIIIS